MASIAPQDLKTLYERRWAPNLIKIPLMYGLWFALGALAWYAHSPWVRWPTYVALGYLQMGIVTIMHECTHGTVFRRRGLNTALGMFITVPFLISYVSFREDHLAHHTYNRSPRDPDAVFYGRRGFWDFVLFYAYCLFGAPLSLAQFGGLYCIKAMRGTKALVHWLEMIAHVAIVVGFVVWADRGGFLAPALELWLYPFFFMSLFNSARFIAEHYGTPYDSGQLLGTRVIISNPLTSYFWNNINWHIGHHVYPAVPWYNLQELHRLMLPELERVGARIDRSYTAVFIDALLHGPESAETLALRNKAGPLAHPS